MKSLLYTIIAICLILVFSSCDDEAEIKVTNKIGSVRLDNISFGEKGLINSLLPGESKSFTLTERMDAVKFPMTDQIKFYMIKGDSRVLLYTKESFKLNKDQKLDIVITKDTEVINPMNETKAAVALDSMLSFKYLY